MNNKFIKINITIIDKVINAPILYTKLNMLLVGKYKKIFHCNKYKYELWIGLIIQGHFYDEKCLKPLIYKGLSQTTYN